MAKKDALLAFQHECGICADYSIPKDGDDATVEQLKMRAKWDNDDYVCRGLILNERFQAHLETSEGGVNSFELGSHLRIKESLRVQDNDKPKRNNIAGPSVVNMVEHNKSSRYNDNKGKLWKTRRRG
ncbi:hypothetical protein Tco_0840260 [Tanacetum coccineum]|uniref:Uncharacterized protein n=1 Tax=Tanacetum coccineum TaxID=301880 RepID=A0ABQ5ATX7_9ASTR